MCGEPKNVAAHVASAPTTCPRPSRRMLVCDDQLDVAVDGRDVNRRPTGCAGTGDRGLGAECDGRPHGPSGRRLSTPGNQNPWGLRGENTRQTLISCDVRHSGSSGVACTDGEDGDGSSVFGKSRAHRVAQRREWGGSPHGGRPSGSFPAIAPFGRAAQPQSQTLVVWS